MAESSHLYQYAPLERPTSFRILELLPGEDHETPRCNIVHVSMDDKPQYEALSYVWGKQGPGGPGHKIYCGPSNAVLKVTGNCLKSLRMLRHSDQDRSLWVDAICIDQSSEKEKGHQVKMMRDIYKSASRVLINPTGVLGFGKKEIIAIAPVLERINSSLDERGQPRISIPPEYKELDEVFHSCGISYATMGLRQHIARLAEVMDWFQRTWVIQEAAVATEAVIILDKVQAPFYEFLSLLIKESIKTTHTEDQISRFQLHGSLHNAPRKSLLQLAYSSQSTRAGRPEDKLFALVGIASDGDHFRDAISYEHDTATIYTEFSRRFFKQSQDLGLLGIVCQCQKSGYFPSWVVRWDSMYLDYPSLWNPLDSRPKFKACGHFEILNEQDKDPRELHLQGIKFDSVTTRSELPAPYESYTAERLRPLFPFLEEELCQLYGQSPKSQTQKRLIYNDIGKAITNTLSRGAMKTDEESAKEALKHLFQDLRPRDLFSHKPIPKMLLETWKHMFAHWKLLVFMKTSRGYMGLVDKRASKGDIICILSGGLVPYVLRPVPGEEGKYRFISEAYIEGIMYGEFMKGKDERNLQDFCLV